MAAIDKAIHDIEADTEERLRYNRFQVLDYFAEAFSIDDADKDHVEMGYGRYIKDILPILMSKNIGHDKFKTILKQFSSIDFVDLEKSSNQLLNTYMDREVSTSIATYNPSRISMFSTLFRIDPDEIENNIAKLSTPEWKARIDDPEYIRAVSWMSKLGHRKYTHPVNSNYFTESNENNLAVLIALDDKFSKATTNPGYYQVEDLEYFRSRQCASLFSEIMECTPEELSFATRANKINRLNSFGVEQLVRLYRKGITDPELIGPALNLYILCNSDKPPLILKESGVVTGPTTISQHFIENALSYLPPEGRDDNRTTKDIAVELSNTNHALWKYHEKSKTRGRHQWSRDQLIKACYQEPSIRTLVEQIINLPISNKNLAIFNNVVQLAISNPEYSRDHAGQFLIFTPDINNDISQASATATAEFIAGVINYAPQSESIKTLFTKESLMDLPESTVANIINSKVLLEDELNPFLFERYFSLNTEAREQLEILQNQSESELWDHDIRDRVSFWRKNEKLFAYLYESGFRPKDFSQFRSMIINMQVVEMIEDPRITCKAMSDLSSKIGINTTNLSYLNSESLMTISNNLGEPQSVKYYKFLLNSNPRIFINTLFSFDKCDLKLTQFLENQDYVKRFESVVKVVGNVTPDLIKKYVLEENQSKRDEYLAIIRNYHQKVFLNEPILDTVTRDQYPLIANEICLTFPGTTYREIISDLDLISDRCDDLSGMVIRSNGYTADVRSEELVVVKNQGERVNDDFLNHADATLKEVKLNIEDNSLSDEAEKILVQLLKDNGSTKNDDWSNSRYMLPVLTTIVDYGSYQNYFGDVRLDTAQASLVDRYLERLESIFGVHYNDNAGRILSDKITNPGNDLTRKFGQLITTKRLAQIKKNIGNKTTVDPDQFDQLLQRLEHNSQANTLQDPSDIGELMSILIESQFLDGKAGLRQFIKSERAKYHYESIKGEYVDPNLVMTGFITKNAAAYYAKFTAGICTAGDRKLYNREDHFDIVLTVGSKVVGDIQVYKVIYEDKPALLFRGFNPSTQIVNKTNAAYLSKQMIEIAKMVASDNNITHSFIPPQDYWHPLTNRVAEGVEEYLTRTYMGGDKKPVDLHVELSDGNEVNQAYMIF